MEVVEYEGVKDTHSVGKGMVRKASEEEVRENLREVVERERCEEKEIESGSNASRIVVASEGLLFVKHQLSFLLCLPPLVSSLPDRARRDRER